MPQKDFEMLFPIMLLERILGSLIIDLGIKRRDKNFQKDLFHIHLQLFDFFYKNRLPRLAEESK